MSKVNTITSILARLVRREPDQLPTGCWDWPGRRCSGHYGQCSMSNKLVMIHRVVWEHFNGPVPDGLELDHVCRNRICANPDHLQAIPKLLNRGSHIPYTPPARIDPSPFRSCPHGNGKVLSCPACQRQARDKANERARAQNAAKTLCKQGHPLVDGGARKNGWKQRFCPICLANAGKKGGYPSQASRPARTHCKWGHPYEGGVQHCRACGRAAAAERRRRAKQSAPQRSSSPPLIRSPTQEETGCR